MKKKNKSKQSGQFTGYRKIGTGTQRADEVVYTSAFRTRQKFGAASPVRHIPFSRPDTRRGGLVKSSLPAEGEKLLRCECGHEVSERDFISNLPTPKLINSLTDFHLIAGRLRCSMCKQKGKAQTITKICY